MKRVIVTPNPYRDKNFATVRRAMDILRASGLDVRLCLPFEVDKSYELPRDLRFSRLDRELPNADMVICFGGDGTILHMAKAATRHNLPILGLTFSPVKGPEGNIEFLGHLTLADVPGIQPDTADVVAQAHAALKG